MKTRKQVESALAKSILTQAKALTEDRKMYHAGYSQALLWVVRVDPGLQPRNRKKKEEYEDANLEFPLNDKKKKGKE